MISHDEDVVSWDDDVEWNIRRGDLCPILGVEILRLVQSHVVHGDGTLGRAAGHTIPWHADCAFDEVSVSWVRQDADELQRLPECAVLRLRSRQPMRWVLENHHVASLESTELGDQNPITHLESVFHAAAGDDEQLGDEPFHQS